MIKKLILISLIIVLSIFYYGCSDAMIASQNVSSEADQFKIFRRVVFYNGITDQYILCIEGYCSIEKKENGNLEVMVKVGEKQYLKHFLGLSDNVTFFAEQIRPKEVSTKRYKVYFKPSVIIPDIERI